MPILTRLPKSMPAISARNPCTKCCRAISPSVTMPMSSCSLSASTVASRLAASSAAPSGTQGAHSIFGLASQAGFGRLPAIVVSSMFWFPPGRKFLDPRDETRHRFEYGPLLIAVGRMPAVGQHQAFEGAFDLVAHRVELGERAVLVVSAL